MNSIKKPSDRPVRQLESSQDSGQTDNDMSTDLDDSLMSLSDNPAQDYFNCLADSLFPLSPISKVPDALRTSPRSSLRSTVQVAPPLKRQKRDIVYPFFGENVMIPKLTALRIMEFLSDRDLGQLAQVSVLLYSAANDDALWEKWIWTSAVHMCFSLVAAKIHRKLLLFAAVSPAFSTVTSMSRF